jgi:hypothetical protein
MTGNEISIAAKETMIGANAKGRKILHKVTCNGEKFEEQK